MVDQEAVNLWTGILSGASVLGMAIFAVWNRILAARNKLAESNAGVAKADSDRAIADAGNTVFTLVSQRLQAVEAELTIVRQDLATVREQVRERDNKIHVMELHVMDLENVLHHHGLTVPTMRGL